MYGSIPTSISSDSLNEFKPYSNNKNIIYENCIIGCCCSFFIAYLLGTLIILILDGDEYKYLNSTNI